MSARFHVAADIRPLYNAETVPHLACLRPLEPGTPVDGFAIHLGYHLLGEDRHGTKDIFIGCHDGNHTTFSSILEIPKESWTDLALAMAMLAADGWIDDLLCADLADEPGPLRFGPEACAICFQHAVIVEADTWPFYPGDDARFQAMLDRHLHVFIAEGISAHERLSAIAQVQAYLGAMINTTSVGASKGGMAGAAGQVSLVFQ